MEKKHFKAIIFDLYGVLALNGWQSFKAQHFTDRPDVWDQVFELGRRVDAGLSDYSELIQFTAEQSGASEATVRYQLEHTVPNNGLFTYIQTELKAHYSLAILSNASDDSVLHIFTEQQRQLFDAIVFSHHVGLTKPHRDMYHVVASKLGVEPDECVYVDDQERHVTGAREAGMHALVYEDTAQLQKELKRIL